MDYDFIVIGAGIAGASTGFELARAARVCLLEREEMPGVHATGRSAALFAPSYGGSEVRAFTRASRAFFDRPPAGFADQPLLRERGCLYIARGDQTDGLDRMIHEIRRSGGRLDKVDAAEARARVPLLRQSYLAAGAFDADAMDINVDALHRGFLRGARAQGARLHTGAEIAGARYQGGRWRIGLGSEEITAPVVINAAGAWADEVAELFGVRPIGLQPLRRTAMLVDAPADADVRGWPTVMDVDEAFYFKPEAGKLLLSPADEIPDQPGDAQPTELDIAIGVERVQAALDIEVRRVSHSWAGLRTFAPDRAPVVGFAPDTAGFFWCAGQGGYGIQMAPALARASAALAGAGKLPPDLLEMGQCAEALSPARFA